MEVGGDRRVWNVCVWMEACVCVWIEACVSVCVWMEACVLILCPCLCVCVCVRTEFLLLAYKEVSVV